jgi:myo-inositol 2-dehydrogenase / D-chiro-inositol 1-dehydrogenase
VTHGRARAAVVGAGPVGRIHARALDALDRVELVAVCGRTAPRMTALAERHRAKGYTSIAAMLERERPQVVCVATGNRDHAAPALAAIDAGAHVFVEKPIAFSLGEARAMVEAARRGGVKLGVDFNHRFSAPYTRALEHVASGRIGTPCYLDYKFAGSLYKELDDPYCQLIETQGHSFDLLRLFGGEIAELHAFLADQRNIGVYTSAAIALRFASGAVGTLLGSWDSSYEHPRAQVLELSGTDGRVVVDDVVDSVRLHEHGRADYVEWRPGLFAGDQRDFWCTIDAHIAAFVDAVLADREPPVTGEDGVRALELTYAAVRSFEQRSPIHP